MRQSGWRSLPPGIPVAAVTSTIGTRLAATFLSFLAGVIAARELGQHGRGILALMIAVPAALSVVGVLGLDTANLRFAGRSHTAFRHIVRLSILFSLVAGTAIAEAWVLAGWRWPFIRLGLSPGLALLSAMICPVAVLVTLLSAAEVGRGRIQIYNLVTAAAMAVYLAAIAALAVSGSLTVVQCFVSYGVSQLLAVVAFLALARKHTHEDGDRIPLQEYRSYSLRAYLPNIAQYGMLRMDVPLIQVLAGTSAVALYAVALPFAEAMLLLPVAVSLVMFPRITSGRLSRAAIAQVSRKVLAGTAALAGVVALVSPVIVPVIYGVAFRGSVAVIWSMLPGIIVFSAGRSMQTFLAATDRLTPVIIASAAGVVIGLVSLLVLTPDLGAAGAGAADSAGYFAYAAVIAGYLRCPGPLIRAGAHTLHQLQAVARIRSPGGNPLRAAIGCAAFSASALAALLSTASTTTVLVVLGALALLAAIAAPSAGLYILAIALAASQTLFAGHAIAARILLLLTAACIIGHLLAGRIVRPKIASMTLALAAVVYFLLSALFAGSAGPTGGDIRSVLILAVVLLGIPLVAGTGRVARQAILVFCFSTALFAIAEIATSRASVASLGTVSPSYAASLTAAQTGALNHNIQGALFVLALAVLLAWLPKGRHGITKACTLVAIVVLLAGIAYSFSRSSFLGAIAVLILFAVRRRIRGLVGLAIVIVGVLPLIPAAVSARLSTISGGVTLDPSSAVRLDLWKSAIRMFSAHPVFGVGYLHFATQLPVYYAATGTYNVSLVNFSDLDYAHNFYLSIPAETGLIGVFLVGALIVIAWRIMWSAMRSRDWIGEGSLLAFGGLVVCSIFGEVMLQAAVLAAFLLVALAGRRQAANGL